MKPFIWVVACILYVGSISYASSDILKEAELTSENAVSPQVCQFSLSSYTGTIDNWGNTSNFTVGLSCPQNVSTYATVAVCIDGELIATKVVEVRANQTQSSSTSIQVSSSYAGKAYKLIVE